MRRGSWVMNRIDAKFRELRARGEKALIIYLTAGFPDLKTTERLVLEAEDSGADIIELGIPFSDPLADGPVIQAASAYALKKGVNLSRIFSLVRSLRKRTGIPVCLMGYYNPIFSYGQVRFINEAKDAGADGIIIPDLPPEEDKWLVSLAGKAGLKTIFFLSPTSSLKRIRYISKVSGGFIYYVSLTGVTGERAGLCPGLKQNIRIIKSYTKKPVCAGFGISKPRHIAEVFETADGAIVGSAVIRLIQDNLENKDLAGKIGRFIKSLKCTRNPL